MADIKIAKNRMYGIKTTEVFYGGRFEWTNITKQIARDYSSAYPFNLNAIGAGSTAAKMIREAKK